MNPMLVDAANYFQIRCKSSLMISYDSEGCYVETDVEKKNVSISCIVPYINQITGKEFSEGLGDDVVALYEGDRKVNNLYISLPSCRIIAKTNSSDKAEDFSDIFSDYLRSKLVLGNQVKN